MSYKNSKTIKEIVYKKYLIKVKKDGECFIFYPNGKKMTWAEHLDHAKWSINVSIKWDKLIKKWYKEGEPPKRKDLKTIRTYKYKRYLVEVKENGDHWTTCANFGNDMLSANMREAKKNIDQNINP